MSSPPEVRRFVDAFTPGETIEYEVREVVHASRSDWQEIRILDLAGHGRTLILDDNIQSAEADEHLYHEALVQPAMLLTARPPVDVLVLGGGEGATLREVLRHRSVERATMVDLDREVIEACKEHLPTFHRGAFEDPRTRLIFSDAAEFVRTAANDGQRFDVVISDVVDPDEAPAKHLFSHEFFSAVRTILHDDGVFVAQIGPAFEGHFDAGARAIVDLEREFKCVRAGRVFVPVYLSPWGFAIAAQSLLANFELVAARIAERLQCPPRSLDASDVLTLLSLPKPQRDEVAAMRAQA